MSTDAETTIGMVDIALRVAVGRRQSSTQQNKRHTEYLLRRSLHGDRVWGVVFGRTQKI